MNDLLDDRPDGCLAGVTVGDFLGGGADEVADC